MPTKISIVTGPDGNEYEIEHPDTATDDEVIAYAREQMAGGEEKPYNWMGLARQALQGLTLGSSDEIGALMATIPASIATRTNPFDVYGDIYSSLEEQRNQFKEENPKSALAAELAGGLATGIYGGVKAAGSNLLRNIGPVGKTALIGGTEGGLYGLAGSDQGERAQGAAVGATVGAAGGPLLEGASRVGGHLLSPVANRVKNAFYSNPADDARNALANNLAKEGVDSVDNLVSPEQARQATLADVTASGRNLMEGLVSGGNPRIRNMAETALEQRNKGQVGRVIDSLDDGLEIPYGATLSDAVSTVENSRSAIAGPLYQQASEQPVKVTPLMRALFDQEKGDPRFLSALQQAQQQVSVKRFAGDEVTHFDLFNMVKQNLDDQISMLYKKGANGEARDLVVLKNRFIGELDEQNPLYKQARDAWSTHSSMLDAGEMGKRVFREDIDSLDDYIKGLSQSELEMFRLGAKKAVREKLLGAREGNNAATRVMGELNLQKLRKAFPSDEAFNKFRDDLAFEVKIYDTTNVLRNSATALRQAAQATISGGDDHVLNQAGSDTAGIIAGGIRRLLGRGMTEESQVELAQILLTPISDLSPDIINRLNRSIVQQLPPDMRPQAISLLRQWREQSAQAARQIPAIAPGITAGATSSGDY